MDKGGFPEDEFDEEIREFKKRHRRKKILLGIAAVAGAAGIGAFSAYACIRRMEEIRDCALESVHKNQRKESIEDIIRKIKTPEQAFGRLKEDITFQPEEHDRWSSMKETYSTGTGDCDDGAIAFAAMLSDNPEYPVDIVYLHRSSGKDHMIAAYFDSHAGLWGYVSFNREESPNAFIEKPVFPTMENAISASSAGKYEAYAVISYGAEDMVSGDSLTLQWDALQNKERIK